MIYYLKHSWGGLNFHWAKFHDSTVNYITQTLFEIYEKTSAITTAID